MRCRTNGMALPPAYEPHKFTGIAPTAELEGGQVYTGSCHCGAVRLAVKSKPLDASYSDKVIECNCSLDGRVRDDFFPNTTLSHSNMSVP